MRHLVEICVFHCFSNSKICHGNTLAFCLHITCLLIFVTICKSVCDHFEKRKNLTYARATWIWYQAWSMLNFWFINGLFFDSRAYFFMERWVVPERCCYNWKWLKVDNACCWLETEFYPIRKKPLWNRIFNKGNKEKLSVSMNREEKVS